MNEIETVKPPRNRPRRTSRRCKTTSSRESLKFKALWADPEWRARTIAKQQAGIAKVPKEQRTRRGVPDGMRKAEATALWDRARKEAKRFIQIMEDANELPKVTIPGSEAEMAKKTLEEAYVNAVSPLIDAKTKSAFCRLVLDFTKSKPESKSKLTLDKSEEWLNALEADMKNDGGSPSDT